MGPLVRGKEGDCTGFMVDRMGEGDVDRGIAHCVVGCMDCGIAEVAGKGPRSWLTAQQDQAGA